MEPRQAWGRIPPGTQRRVVAGRTAPDRGLCGMASELRPSLSVIILTFNEEMHIERAVGSASAVARQVFVVDCGSNDRTREIAERAGAVVLQNPWVNHATQLNWALDHCPVATDWIMRLDADEWLSDGLRAELLEKLGSLPQDVVALALPLRRYFMGRPITHGGVGRKALLRVFRRGQARCDSAWMDERIIPGPGRVVRLEGWFADDSLRGLTWWIDKHNGYASREALNLLIRPRAEGARLLGAGQSARVKWMKENFYYRVPSLLRSPAYFLFRYFLLLGFLDGAPGLIFHFFQGFWYRSLVDAKVFSVRFSTRFGGRTLAEAVREQLSLELPEAELRAEGARDGA